MISSDRVSPHAPEIVPVFIQGESERQVPALESFPFPLLNGIGVGAVDQILPQDTQLR